MKAAWRRAAARLAATGAAATTRITVETGRKVSVDFRDAGKIASADSKVKRCCVWDASFNGGQGWIEGLLRLSLLTAASGSG